MFRPSRRSTLFPYTTLFRSGYGDFKLLAALGAWLGWQMLLPIILVAAAVGAVDDRQEHLPAEPRDRKSTRLNSSHEWISYAVFCLKKKKRERSKKELTN